MKYEKAKVIRIDRTNYEDSVGKLRPDKVEGKVEKASKTINEGIKNGWQPISISSATQPKADVESLYILMGKPEDE